MPYLHPRCSVSCSKWLRLKNLELPNLLFLVRQTVGIRSLYCFSACYVKYGTSSCFTIRSDEISGTYKILA